MPDPTTPTAERRPPRAVVAGVLVVGVVAVAASALITREAYEAAGGGTTGRGMLLAFVRMGLAAVLTLPAWRGARSLAATLPTGTRPRVVAAGVLLGLHFATWLPSLAFTSIAASATIVTSVPVWVVLIGWVAWGERPSSRTSIGVAVAMLGGALVATGEVEGLAPGSRPLLGNALALVAAIAYAGHLLLARDVQARGLGLWRWTTIVGAVGALSVVPLVVATTPGDGPFPARFWAMAVALCLVSQLVGHSSLTWSVRWLSATLVSVVILFEPVLATLGAAVLYDEVPGAVVGLGALVLVAGVGVTTTAEPRSPASGDGSPSGG